MNIYLDIDGVILANENNLSLGAVDFIKYITDKYDVYWLTTQCMDGDPSWPIEYINRSSQEDLTPWLNRIIPTSWSENKTEAIDFSKPFIWFDDDLFTEEREELIKHDALDSWIEIDLRKDPDMLLKLIKNFPI